MRLIPIATTAVVGVLLAAPVLAQSTAPNVIPIEHFTKFDDAGDLQLSPDGEHFAFVTKAEDTSLLVVSSTKTFKPVSATRFPRPYEIYEYHWVSNTRLIYQQAQRFPGRIEPTPTGELGAIDFNGKSGRFIYGYRAGEQQTGTRMKVRMASFASPRLISPLYNDDKHILIEEHPWKNRGDTWYYDRDAKPFITRIDVYSGTKKALGTAPLRDARVMVDHDDQPRFAIGENDQFEYSVSWRQHPEGAWSTLALPGFINDTVVPRIISADNQSLLFTAAKDKEPVSLYQLNLDTKETTKVFGIDNSDVTGVVLDFAEENVIGVVSYTDKRVIHWLDKEDKATRLYRSLMQAFPNASVHVASATRDGSLAIVFVHSDVAPGEYFLFNPQTMKADLLLYAQKQIDPRQMRPREPFALQARDGVRLTGYVTKPAGPGPHPLVVLPHGGPHQVRDYWEYDWEAQLLANRGYAVLQVNFRGSSGLGHDFERLGHRQWGATMQDDLTDATRWAIEQKITDTHRICIYGASYGGYAALQGAVREPDLYRCAIGYAGVYDLELMHTSGDTPDWKTGRAYLEKVLGTDMALLRSRSPNYNADKIKAPVLLIHGKEDARADFQHAKRMKAALENANKAFEWMALSREGHGAYDEATRREVYECILAFLDKHLKNGATQATN